MWRVREGGDMTLETQIRFMRPRSKECQQLLKAGRKKEWVLPLESPERASPADILILAHETDFGLLPSRNVRAEICVVLSH